MNLIKSLFFVGVGVAVALVFPEQTDSAIESIKSIDAESIKMGISSVKDFLSGIVDAIKGAPEAVEATKEVVETVKEVKS